MQFPFGRTGVTFLCCLGVLASVDAEDRLTRLEVRGTFGPKVYEEVTVLGTTSNGLKIAHKAGLATIPFNLLPEELRAKFGPAIPAPSPPLEKPPQASPEMPAPAPAAVDGKVPAAPGQAIGNLSFDSNCLVMIQTESKGGKGSGSGFIAREGGRTYVYTNAHVICGDRGAFTSKIVGIKSASGRVLKVPFEVELSQTSDASSSHGLEDVARFPIEAEPSAYEIASLGQADVQMEQDVVAYGNSAGAGVITSLAGKVLGISDDKIEIDCEIIPGNSGGPVIKKDTRQVIGISTFLTAGKKDIWAKGTKFESVRRFAMRPDKVTKWRKMQLTSLYSALAELNSFDRDTLSLAAACFLNPRVNRGGFEVPTVQQGDYIIRELIVEGSSYQLGGVISGGVAKVNQRLGGLGGKDSVTQIAMSTVVPVYAEFFSAVANASNSQVSVLSGADRVPYLKKMIPSMLETRKEIMSNFARQAERFR